jgi:hypothetical protein
MQTDFAGNFGIYKLYPFLKAHDAAKDHVIEWFWKQSKHWSALTQESFDAIAQRRILTKCNHPEQYLADDEATWLALFDKKNPTIDMTSRRIRREIPISQIKALRTPEGDLLMPWDNKPACRAADFHETFHKIIDNWQEDLRREIINQFQKERPVDYAFLLGYIASKRKKCHTAQERRRAKTIIDRLRRLEATEFYPSKNKVARG